MTTHDPRLLALSEAMTDQQRQVLTIATHLGADPKEIGLAAASHWRGRAASILSPRSWPGASTFGRRCGPRDPRNHHRAFRAAHGEFSKDGSPHRRF
jgi:hypothetical protein